MAILVVGSVAFDTIQSSFGKAEKILGGSATYFSLAASYFTDVRIVAVVGDDFTREHEDVLRRRGVCLKGLQRAPGKTFHWGGEYGENINEAKTHFTDLNVFEKFQPRIPAEYFDSEFLFLANIDPVLQAQVRRELKLVRLVGGDTMNFWINGKRRELLDTLKLMDLLLINDTEAKMLAGESNLLRAANKVMVDGPQGAGHQARRVRRHHFLRRPHVRRHRPPSVPCARAAAGRSPRSHRRRRFLCRRIHGLHRLAGRIEP